jgi:hypothetical protein
MLIENRKDMLRDAGIDLGDSKEFEELVYRIISGISYLGDVRMLLNAEDPEKPNTFVEENIEGFRELYRNRLQAKDEATLTLHHRFVDTSAKEELWRLAQLTTRKSIEQTAKGLVTAGRGSFTYIGKKRAKGKSCHEITMREKVEALIKFSGMLVPRVQR